MRLPGEGFNDPQEARTAPMLATPSRSAPASWPTVISGPQPPHRLPPVPRIS
jgi:hypothetical protein